jgi:oxygen-independent coproporphyrinogen-3 oxidase
MPQDTPTESILDKPLHTLKLPRYTSYPPATEFDALSGHDHARWLKQIPRDEPVSLYIHIPYCRQLCWFCGCFTSITQKYERVRRYLGLLLQEIAVIGDYTGRLNVTHVHFGGGSPTILTAADFATLMDSLRDHYCLLPDAEVAVEIDPRTVDAEKINAYAAAGVTRASLGVQDFKHAVQAAVNRIQPYEQVRRVVDELRAAGIDRLNLDLMYGLPHQDAESVADTARRALTLEPDRLAVFGYAHVPWMRKHQRVLDDTPMATPEQRPAMFDAMRGVFTGAGYVPVGIDHFVRPGDTMARALAARTLKRNFQGYTTDPADTLLGFGVSAISALPDGYAQHTTAMDEYEQAVINVSPAARRGRALTAGDRLRRDIISELMCYYDVDLAAVCARHNLPVDLDAELERLKAFQARGLVSIEGATVRLHEQGRPYVRAVCSVFDQYYEDTGRFSLAV